MPRASRRWPRQETPQRRPSAVGRRWCLSATSGPTSNDERQNFANWYSYARNRMNLMKTASGEAFHFALGRASGSVSSPSTRAVRLQTQSFSRWTKFTGKPQSRPGSASSMGRRRMIQHLCCVRCRAGRYFAGKADGINDGMIGTSKAGPDHVFLPAELCLPPRNYWNKGGGRSFGSRRSWW